MTEVGVCSNGCCRSRELIAAEITILTIRVFTIFLLMTTVMLSGWLTEAVTPPHLTEQERHGRRIYLRGESASGRALTVTIGDDSVELPASTLPCAGCHGADGRGKPEGGLIPSDLTWAELTKPYGHRHPAGRVHPTFTEQSLERAIVEGVDPAGNQLSPAMPKYQMSRADLNDLLAYLRRLADDRDPGVTNTTITVGTLLPVSGPMAETGQAMREVLTAYFEELNQQGGIYQRRLQLLIAQPEQAQQFLATESVFALVGAMPAGAEQEVAALVSREETPLIAPYTLNPQLTSPPDRHIFYLLAGLPEQVRGLAKFATQQMNPFQTKAALIVLEDTRANELADAMVVQCQQLGWKNIKRYTYPRGQLQAGTLVKQLQQEGMELVFFLGASGDETTLINEAAKVNYTFPLYLPGSLAARATLNAIPTFRQKIYLAYPTTPIDQTPAAWSEFQALLARHQIAPRHTAAQLSAYIAAKLFAEGLKRASRDLTREKLLTALEGLYEFDTGLTPRLTFGPNRRIGAFGVHIVTFDRTKKAFVPAGNWVSLTQ